MFTIKLFTPHLVTFHVLIYCKFLFIDICRLAAVCRLHCLQDYETNRTNRTRRRPLFLPPQYCRKHADLTVAIATNPCQTVRASPRTNIQKVSLCKSLSTDRYLRLADLVYLPTKYIRGKMRQRQLTRGECVVHADAHMSVCWTGISH